MAAFFRGHAFTPHRHDTYAVGVTSAGIQSFRYRGAARHSLPSQVFVLHPDERHDGRAGDERGFGYRIAYVDPKLIGDALAAKTLPFVRDPISDDARLGRAIIDRSSTPTSCRWPCFLFSNGCRRSSGPPSSCTTSSISRSTRSPPLSVARLRGAASSPPAQGSGSGKNAPP